jgi:glycosyltransferase involved in cell wall biosynthesis
MVQMLYKDSITYGTSTLPKPLTIALDLRFASLPGGGRAYMQKLLPALVTQDPNTQWQVFTNANCPHQQEIIRQAQMLLTEQQSHHHIEIIPVRSPCLSLRHHVEFRRLPKTADLYHYPHFDLPLTMRDLPLVITIHDLYPLTVPGYCSALKRAYFQRLTKHNVHRADKVIAISEHTKKDLIQHLQLPAEKITVIPQSHAPQYQPIENANYLESIRRKYSLPNQFILYTGNHKPHKNLPRLLQAFAQLDDSLRQTFHLVLTGQVGAEAGQLLQLATKLNIQHQIHFTGWLDQQDLPAVYNLASLVVLPSLYEGFGLATLEAMACGIPVACSNVTAIPEVVGALGRQFDPHHVEQITQALNLALTHDLSNPQLRQALLERAAQFSVHATAQMTCQLYHQTAK